MAGLLDKAKATNDTEDKVEKPDDTNSGLLSKGASKVVTTTTVTTTSTSTSSLRNHPFNSFVPDTVKGYGAT